MTAVSQGMNYADRVIVALDTGSIKEAEAWIKLLSKRIKYFKVGSQLFTACGQDAVKMVHNAGREVFLDLKFHDIPSTVAKSVESAAKLGIWMLNVHASGGKKMMESARRAADSTDKRKKPILIAVTVLTSMGKEDLVLIGVDRPVEEQVKSLARLAKESGLDGIVASAQEAKAIKENIGKEFIVVTPGVRPAWATSDDQTRIVTPLDAFRAGADYIVIGRPITNDPDPVRACLRLMQELAIS